MATKDMAVVLGGVLMPKPDGFNRILEANETDIRTLGGILYTDFVNNIRSWSMSWKYITQEDYAIIERLYLAQYTNNRYAMLQFNAYSIYAPVKIKMSNQKPKFNGSVYEDFSITLIEQNPFS